MKRYELFSYRAEDNAEMREDSNGEWVMFSPLIAAAPELLEALIAIAKFIPITSASEGGASTYSAHVRAADKVRAAIARATGGAV